MQAEPDVMATAGSDRGIALYDLRTSTPIRKLIMQTKTNSIAWNPMEAFNFTAASEDCNLYTYDMRKLQSASCVHKDFVSAVMDVDYSPTGREFVAGSYDRSVRIFSHNGGHSKEVYHTKRMQRIFAVRFSGDGSYVFSGSDDMNVRVWKVGLHFCVDVYLGIVRQPCSYCLARFALLSFCLTHFAWLILPGSFGLPLLLQHAAEVSLQCFTTHCDCMVVFEMVHSFMLLSTCGLSVTSNAHIHCVTPV